MTHKGLPQIPVRSLPSLVEAADLVFRNKRTLAGVATAITLSAMLYVAAAPSVYRSQALLLLRNDRSGSALHAASGAGAPPRPVTENDVRTEVEILQSRDVLERSARAAGMIAPENRNSGEMDAILARIRQSLVVTAIPKSDMIRLEYVNANRWEGAHFLHELTRIHQDRYVALRTGAKLKTFEEEADRLNAELKEKQKELSEFQRTSDVHSMAEQKTMLLSNLGAAEATLHDMELRRIDSQQRVAQLTAILAKLPPRVTTEVRRVPNQYSTERLRTMLVELENRKADAEQIERTRRALAEATGSQAVEEASNVNPNRQSMENDLARAQLEAASAGARLAKLSWQVAKFRKELDRLESVAAEFETLSREVRELDERYQLNTRKAEEVRIHTSLDDRRITNVVLAQEPQVPGHAETRPYWIALGVWMGAMTIAAVLVMVFSRSRKTFYTPGCLEDFAGIPVLGTVPLQRRLIG